MSDEVNQLDEEDDALSTGRRTPLFAAPSTLPVTGEVEAARPSATVSTPPPLNFSVVEIDGKLCLRDAQGNVQLQLHP